MKDKIFKILHIFLLVFLISLNGITVYAASTPTVKSVTPLATTVGKYKKFEATIDLSQTYSPDSLTPYYYYDPNDNPSVDPGRNSPYGVDGISVDVVFSTPSKKTVTVPAFYYQDYVRGGSPSTSETMTTTGTYNWKVRYAPSEVGSYAYHINITDKNGSTRYPASGDLSFTSNSSDSKGFIRVSNKDPRFMEYDDGSTFIPIASGRQWPACCGKRSWDYDQVFNTYGANGINFTRIWDQNDGYGLTVEGRYDAYAYPGDFNPIDNGVNIDTIPKGTQPNQRGNYEEDKIIEAAEKNSVYIQLTSHGDPYWIWDAATYSESWNKSVQPFDSARHINAWKRNFRYRVARWGYSTSIMGWEAWNEHGHVLPDTQVYNFYKAYSQYQSQIDPYKHLRTTSQGSQAFSPAFWSSGFFDAANYHNYMMGWASADLKNDEANFVYRTAWCLRDITKSTATSTFCNGLGLGDSSIWSTSRGNMPWVWGEIDVGTDTWDQVNPLVKTGEGRIRMLHNTMWSGLFSPLGTTPIDWYWGEEDAATTSSRYAQRKIAANFLKDVNYTSGNLGFVMGSSDTPPGYSGETLAVSTPDIRVYGMKRSDKTANYLWIQNKKHTWANATSTGSPINGKVTISNLLPSAYKVEVWDTYTGNIISTNTITPTSSSIDIPVTNLITDFAVKVVSASGIPTPSVTPSPTPTSNPTPTPSVTPTSTPTSTPTTTATPLPTPTPTTPAIGNGDTNGDGVINTADIGNLITNWTVTNNNLLDQYKDSNINSLDFAVIASYINAPKPSTSPTPTPTQTPTPTPIPTPTPTINPTPIVTPTPVPSSTPTGTSTDWLQLQHDPQHTGRSSVSVDPNYQAKWVWMDKSHIVTNFVSSAGKSITDSFSDKSSYVQNVLFATSMQPIVAKNVVLFGAMNGAFYAVDAGSGSNKWDYTTGGPIIGTAASDGSTVVFGSMDGKVYGIDVASGPVNGQPKWSFATGAGVSGSPIINNGTVFVGSRDGKFYALDVATGSKKWSYTTRVEPADANSPFNSAPIFSTAAISEDGSIVFFGAENDFFYALNVSNGSEKWAPKKLNGQSFQLTWPVVKGNLVMITSTSSYGTPEYNMESVLDSLPASPTWAQQRDAINKWLDDNPQWRLFRVFNVNDGSEPFKVAAGPYSPFGLPFVPPVVDNQNRILWPYWRVKDAEFFQQSGIFGTKYGLDLSAMDPNSGDRIVIKNNGSKFPVEIDNVFNVTVGGNNIFLQEGFRGVIQCSLSGSGCSRVTTALANWDGADNRGWGSNIIYYGNDSTPSVDPRPRLIYKTFSGLGSGVSIANVNGTPMMFVNEADVVGIVGIVHKP